MTLIEILVVITLMALIGTAVAVAVLPAVRSAREKQARTDASTIATAALRFRVDQDRCPNDVDSLVADGYLDRARRASDPWDRTFRVTCEPDEVVVTSAGADGVFETEDDVRN